MSDQQQPQQTDSTYAFLKKGLVLVTLIGIVVIALRINQKLDEKKMLKAKQDADKKAADAEKEGEEKEGAETDEDKNSTAAGKKSPEEPEKEL